MKTTKTLVCCALPFALAGCSMLPDTQALERGQRDTTQLLEQQSVRLEMQEEYMAQLAEAQQEMVNAVARLSSQLGQLQTRLSVPADAKAAANAPAKPADQPRPKETIGVADISSAVADKQVVGRNEWVWLDLLSRNLKARVDTGALSSSLNATDLQPFERDGREWIRFRVPDEDHPDGGDTYETPLVKYVRIRQASADDLERRPVVRLKVRLGDLIDEAEFNLTNREDMMYPVLLGRNFLRDVALVDVAQRFTQPKHVPDLSRVKLK